MLKRSAAIFIAIITFFLQRSDLASAQSSNSIDIRVSARVVKSIEMVTMRNMRFGEVQPGQQQINISSINDPNTGKMAALGIPGAQIRVSFVREQQLVRTDGTGSIIFTYEIAGNDIDDQSSAELLQTDNRNLQLNNTGEYYFWIGGRVDISDAPPGNYQGDFTIEIEYI